MAKRDKQQRKLAREAVLQALYAKHISSEEAKKVLLKRRVVAREEAMVNAGFDAWLDASDALVAWFPCEPIEEGLV